MIPTICKTIDFEHAVLNEAVGSQDQIAAVYGGLNVIQFHPDEEVTVLDLVNRIMAMCGTRVDIGYDAKPVGDPSRRLLDLSKAERILWKNVSAEKTKLPKNIFA